MIVKILKSSGSFPAIEYNENKVSQGVAERVELRNFGYLQDNPDLASADSIVTFLTEYSETSNNHLKFPQFHVTFSAKGNSMSKDELVSFANKWLKQMGYENNPIAIYFHHDTDNNHLHVITSRVGLDGKKINHNHERRRSQQVINDILHQHPKNDATELVNKALSYSFQTVGQFRSILECSSYQSYEEDNKLNVTKGGVVVHQINFSAIKNHITNDDIEERKKRGAQLRAWLLRYKAMCYDKEELTKLMHAKFGVDLIFHGKGIGEKEFKPYGYTLVDHHTKKVFKGSDILSLKQLLEFIPYSRDEKEKQIFDFINDTVQRNRLITTVELNKLLKKETNVYVSKGNVVLRGQKLPLNETISSILKTNDRIAWVQSFNPCNLSELNALCAMFKIQPEDLKISNSTHTVDKTVLDSLSKIASSSTNDTFRDNLSRNGYRLFYFESEYYILSFSQRLIINANECVHDHSLLDSSHTMSSEGSYEESSLNIAGDLLNNLPDSHLDTVLNVTEDILSLGETGSGVGGGQAKDLSKKKKKKKGEDEEGGISY